MISNISVTLHNQLQDSELTFSFSESFYPYQSCDGLGAYPGNTEHEVGIHSGCEAIAKINK